MGEFVPYLIAGLVILLLVAVTIWVIRVNKISHRQKILKKWDAPKERTIVVPTKEQLEAAFEAYQQGGDALLGWVRQNRQEHQPTVESQPPSAANEKTNQGTSQLEGKDKQQQESVPEIERLPNETFVQRLKRLSQQGHPSGKFVKGSNLGPIIIMSPTSHEKPKESSSE